MADQAEVTTFVDLLKHAKVPDEEVAQKFGPEMKLVKRLLGVQSNSYPFLEIHPPVYMVYNVLVPNLFNVPVIDMGMGIGPVMRSMVAYVSSRAFGCA